MTVTKALNGQLPAALLADDDRLPSFEGNEDADSRLVSGMLRSVALPSEVLDWCMMAEAYSKNGRRLADRYIELYSLASTGRRKTLVEALEALSWRKFHQRSMMGGGGAFGGGGGK